MKIDAIAATLPSLEITNEQIAEFIERFNPSLPKTVVSRYQRVVSQLLKKSGAETRYVRNPANNETALQLVKKTINNALSEARIDKEEIDLLIYCGIGKGFLEPANSYFLANAMGLQCQCFDVTDACMSWVRALELAHLFLKNDSHKRIMIVNAEFNSYERGFPELYKIHSFDQLAYTFPAYTIGEATTATIVSKSEKEWSFTYKSAPQFVDLCAIPLNGYKDFVAGAHSCDKNGVGKFYAYGKKMIDIAREYHIPFIKELIHDVDEPDIWFPHLPSKNAVVEMGSKLGIPVEKLQVKAFPKYGNLVSATIPTAMKMAQDEKKLKTGDKVVLCPVSAGMSFAVVEFVWG